jgi:hypothetical protein
VSAGSRASVSINRGYFSRLEPNACLFIFSDLPFLWLLSQFKAIFKSQVSGFTLTDTLVNTGILSCLLLRFQAFKGASIVCRSFHRSILAFYSMSVSIG